MFKKSDFDSELHYFWFLALTEGGLGRRRNFPLEINETCDKPCWVCSNSDTEIVSHENDDGRPRDRYLHIDCFEEYVNDKIDGDYVTIHEIVTVNQHPRENLPLTSKLPDEVSEAYQEYLKDIKQKVQDR